MLVDNSFWDSHGQTRLQQMDLDAAFVEAAQERAQTAEALLQEADALVRLSLIFRMQSNRFVPISRLQPEILLRIFHFLAECYPPSMNRRGPGSLGWVYATHVCHSWRDILLNDSTIWGRNVGKIPKAFDVFLQRSGSQVPLHLYMGVIQSRASWSSRPLHRVHILHCFVLDYEQYGDLHNSLSADSPSEIRELRTYRGPRVERNFTPQSRSPQWYAPGLVSWKSEGVYVNIAAPSLTEVELKFVGVDAAMLLGLFMHSPLLESFVAEDLTLFEADENSILSDSMTSLPRLRQFEVMPIQWTTPTINVLEAIMFHIVFPDSANISLDYARRHYQEVLEELTDFDSVLFLMEITPRDTSWELDILDRRLSFSTITGTSCETQGKRSVCYRFRIIEELARIFRDCTLRHTDAFERIVKMKVCAYDSMYWESDREEVAYFSDVYGPVHSSIRTLEFICTYSRDSFPPNGAFALNHVNGTDIPFPNLRCLRVGIGNYYDEFQAYPRTQEIIEWLEPRRTTRTLPSTLCLDRFRFHDENSTVDPKLLALIPDTRFVDREELDSDDDEE